MSSTTPRPLHAVVLALAAALACHVPGDDDRDERFEPQVLPLPDDPGEYDPLPSYAPMDVPADNPLSAARAALGRQLHYDPRLSADGTLSCYSCHRVEFGLTDGRPVSRAGPDNPLPRSSPTLWNIGYHEFWHWDGSADTLESQVHSIWTGAAMGAPDPGEIVARLAAVEGYRRQFADVFGGPPTAETIVAAITSYLRTIVSAGTPWDRFMAGEDDALTPAQRRGWGVFQAVGCVGCHAGALFTDLQFHNVGIGDLDAELPDEGRFRVSLRELDRGAFKTPTLRDVTKSAPYFHDGSAATLEEAVRLMLGEGLPNLWMTSPRFRPVDLEQQDFEDLVAFMSALDQPPTPAVAAPPPLP